MALLLPPGFRVLDANGLAVNGGRVRVYEANSTNLASLFSDAALTVTLSNPVSANSAGYPSSNGTTPTLVFIGDGNYDVACLQSVAAGGAALPYSGEDVPALGSDSATFTKDFTNARVAIRGSGGVVYIEAGDASPDNTGGTGRLGGWNGTQADSWTLDAALVNAGTTAGALKENSKKLPSTVYTEATTFTTVATLDIPLTNSPSGVRAWEVEVFDLILSAAAANNLRARFSYDGGGTYKAGAADYNCQVLYGTTITATATGTYMEVAISGDTPANSPAIMLLKIITPDSGLMMTRLTGRYDAYDATSASALMQFPSGFGLGSYGRATHIRLFPESGTITGKYLVRPLRGYGET